jgi:sugar/nucleoside kinase (ribokinase family)
MPEQPDVLCAGIIVADHVCAPIEHLPAAGELVTAERMLLTIGGCAANAAVDLVKMGVAATVVGRVGGDIFGRVVRELLREQGVDGSGIQVSPEAETSQTLIVNVAGQDRRFIHTFGANAEFRAADIPMEALGRCRVLYVGGYLVMPRLVQEELAAVFAAARRAGVRTVLDVVAPGRGDYLSRLERLLPHVDVFLPNNHEAELISGETEPLRQAEFFHRMGAGTVVITLGGEGSVLLQDGLRLRAGAFAVPYVDGSGGGDAFDAGYICGLLRGLDAEGCLRLASALGASCVRAIGTTPGVFTRAECEQFLQENMLRVERV